LDAIRVEVLELQPICEQHPTDEPDGRDGEATLGEWKKLARLDKTEELLTGDIGARPIRHHDSEVLGALEARAVVLLRMRKRSEHRVQVREEEEEDGKAKSQISARRVLLKGTGATPHLQHRTHRICETFVRSRACPVETTAHSRDASVPVEYRLAESARNHDGAVTSVTSAEMPAPITAPTITTTAITAPTKRPQATTATITNKSS
jgi:hypothetical protein